MEFVMSNRLLVVLIILISPFVWMLCSACAQSVMNILEHGYNALFVALGVIIFLWAWPFFKKNAVSEESTDPQE